TIRPSYFKIIQPGYIFLYKIITSGYPTHSDRGEKSILSAGLKVFRPGITKVYIHHISIVIIVRKPAGYSLITKWDSRHIVGSIFGVFPVINIVIYQTRYTVYFIKNSIVINRSFQMVFPELIDLFIVRSCFF